MPSRCSFETYWVALHASNNKNIYFDRFGVEMFLKKLRNLLKIKT